MVKLSIGRFTEIYMELREHVLEYNVPTFMEKEDATSVSVIKK